MQANKIVEGNNLKELLRNALDESNIRYIVFTIENHSLVNSKRTLVEGEMMIKSGYPKCNKTEHKFEVNIGTNKDELVLFDEFEVVIE